MRGFDVLADDLPLFQSHFIEASAGTGKTFAIENLVVRLLRHPQGPTIDQILVVTFTRAATLELKERIRAHLERVWRECQEKRLSSALAAFDEARIMTIHSFCFQSLHEQALEVGLRLDHTEESAPEEILHEVVRDYFRTAPLEVDELDRLLNACQNDLDKLVTRVIHHSKETVRSYAEVVDRYRDEAAALVKMDGHALFESLVSIAPFFKGFCDRSGQLKPERYEELKILSANTIEGKPHPLLLAFLPQNRLKRGRFSHSSLWDALENTLLPLAEEIYGIRTIFARVAMGARALIDEVVCNRDLLFFDDLLKMMQKNVTHPHFAERVRSSYKAVLIDEFQDTDPLQWEIFSTLFFTDLFRGPVYVVGDPKQSIYRFRDADIYTYLSAKEMFGKEKRASLQRNYRSGPRLIKALNFLFGLAEDFFPLPKWNTSLSCPPLEWDMTKDPEEGTLHFWTGEAEEDFYPAIVKTILTLHEKENIPYGECAVLVKDRYQAERFQRYAHKKGLRAVTARSRSLVDSIAYPTLLELIEALVDPADLSAVGIVLGGPLFRRSHHEIQAEAEESVKQFYMWSQRLKEEGILTCFLQVMESRREIFSWASGVELYEDMLQLVEMVAARVSSFDRYLPFLRQLSHLSAEDESLKARQSRSQDAVQILTIHMSKGLEYDVVFPIGLILPSTRLREWQLDSAAHAEEVDAEKMRQLYVALTRARKQLFVPVIPSPKKKRFEPGTASPLHLFLERCLKGREFVEVFSACDEISIGPCVKEVNAKPRPKQIQILNPPPHLDNVFAPISIHSFSSLAQKKAKTYTPPIEGMLPAGAETGSLLHRVFEHLPFEKAFSIKDPLKLQPLIHPLLQNTALEKGVPHVAEMVVHALHTPLPFEGKTFPLSAVDPPKILKEMEFLTQSESHFLKGFVDLFFEFEGKYYLLDWKSNYLESYDYDALQKEMKEQDYFLQSAIYCSAARRYLALFGLEAHFKGAFYLFLRGLPEGGIVKIDG